MIKTTVVGSYPVPTWLRVFPSQESLRDAMMVVIKTQELAGLDVVADGELNRWDVNHPETNGMIDYFLRPLSGIATKLSRRQLESWRAQAGMGYRASPAAVVTGPLDAGSMNLLADYSRYRDLTDRPKKFTLTSPFMLAKVLMDEHYHDFEKLVMALAEILGAQLAGIDAEVIQVDEANVTGHAEQAAIAAAGINRVLASVTTQKAVHLCYGNYGGQSIQQGTYQKLLGFLNALDADHVVLEIARRPDVELSMLKDVKPEIGLGIGVIDIKDNEVETTETVCQRIARAAELLGPDRIHYVHPDCGFWMLPRSVADAKMAALVAGRNQFEGR